MEEVQFDVNDQVEIESLDDVEQSQFVLPPASNVLLSVAKVKASTTKDGGFKQLEVSYRLVEGIETDGELKYKNVFANTFPQRIFYWVSSEKKEAGLNAPKSSTRDWYKNKQYLVEFKNILNACGITVNEFLKDGKLDVDNLIPALQGKEVRGNIVQFEETMPDRETGEKIKTGRFLNEVRYLKAV